jgi:NAD(P)-dependent dehydrogenase (short-subunit alcohol dehydrogenase family)
MRSHRKFTLLAFAAFFTPLIDISGFCQTEMMDNAEKILGTKMPTPANTIQNRISDPHEMAKPIIFMLSSFASYITGMSYAVDGGWEC